MFPIPKQTRFRLTLTLTLALALTTFTLFFAAAPRLVASVQPNQPTPPDLHTIWQRVQQAPSYAFTADIAQTVYPAPTVYNVGRAPQTSHLYLEGTAQPARQTLEMTLWAGEGRSGDPASGFDLRSDGQESFVREHGRGEWQPVGDLTGIMAPNGDNLAYLAAATNIQTTPLPDGHIRYTFDLDGDAFAQHTTQAMQQSLIQRGELPPTTQLTPPDYLRQLSGHGDLLTTADGWPLSQNIHIALTLEDGQHLTADLASTFSGFDLATTPETPLLSLTTLLPIPRATANVSPSPALLATATALFLLLAVRVLMPYWQSFWRSHRRLLGQWLGRGFAALMVFALVVPQLVHAEQVGAFYDAQRTQEAAQQSRQAEATRAEDLQEARTLLENGLRGPAALDALRQDTGQDSDRDGLTDAQELVLGSNPFTAVSIPGQPDLQTALARPALTPAYLALATQDSGQDSDSDGLTDYEETLLGTDPHGADSDGDGISDQDEVVGFELNGRAYNTDPLKADSNEDGLDDGREWNTPNTPHATWDLDSDGTPDLFDPDNDGDGIPDRLDVSPMQVVTAVFGETAPLQLALNGLTPGRVTYTEFQLRPTNPDQLRYAFNVYNWPDNDTSGQIRDTDGATFASLDPTLPTHPNSNGDLKLIPMLEIRATGDPNSPLRDTPAPLPPLTVERLNRASNIEGNIQLNQTINGPEFVFNLQDLFGQPLSDSDYVYAIYSGSCARLGDEVSLARPAWGNTHLRPDLNLGDLLRTDHAILLLSENTSDLTDPNLGLSCTDIPRQAAYGDQWVDTSLIQNYGISLSELAPNDYLIYSPVEMVSDSQTGERFGFYSKMVYQPTTSNWGAAQQVRLVWVVQGLLDEECRNGLCPNLNRLGVIQTYYSDWQLTGFSVEEHLTAEVGIIYEDPTAKNDLLGYNTVEQLAREEYLLGLAYELGYDWLEAPDCDTADANGRCIGDGQRDYTLTTIQSRLNDGVPTAERWFLPDIFGMETYQYSHLDEAWADVLSQRNTAVLNNAFGGTRNLFDPSLLFLSESNARTGNLDQRLDPTDPLATFDPSASRLTLDLSQQDAITTVAMSLAPYRYDLDQGGWQNADLATYLDGQFTTIYGPEWQDDVQAGALTATEADGNLMLARLYYMALHEGLANAIAIGGVPLSVSLGQPALKKTALFSGLEGGGKALKFLLNNLFVALGVVAGGYNSFSLKSLRTLLGTFMQENDVLKLGKIINLYQWDTSSKKAIAKTVLGNLGVTLLLVVIIVAVVALALAFAVLYLFSLQGQQWATITVTLIIAAVQFFLAIVLPIITVIKTAYAIKNTAGGFLNATAFVLSGPTYLTKNTIGAAIFGLIVEVGVLWGIFFYFWISQGLQPGSLAFNQALALTLAATIVAVFFFVLSLLTWGWLIVGAIGAIDIVLMVLCNVANIAIACFSLRQLITQFVADSFYGADITLDTNRTDLVRISGLKLALQEPRKGLVAGNQLVPSLTVTTNPHQNATHMNAFQASRVLAHADKFFSASALRDVTFRYSLNKPLPAVDLGQMRDEWQDVRVYDQLRVGYTASGAGDRRVDLYAATAVQTISADPITLTAGLNQPIPLTFHTSYAVPVAECWGASYLSTCKVQTAQGQQSTTNLGLVLDILPATLDEFAAFNWDDTLPTPRDADNDGLLAAAYNGLDPDDTRWDSDGDGLSDGYELDYRQRAVALDPNTADTDSDGLSDHTEIFVTNTNPTRPDSDGDGLTDRDEVDGWRFAYSADGTQTTLVTSDPTRPDSDGDGMSDRLEKELHEQYGYPFHPRLANAPIVSLETQTDLTRPFVTPNQTFRYTTTLTNNSKPLDNLWASGTLTTTPTTAFNSATTSTP
ncbi:MAG: DUF4064 domain-containing protein, partial [Anaerolineales bacterium]|nr:DUF4064 domain-containing protein [Anaerolineales bacterium]